MKQILTIVIIACVSACNGRLAESEEEQAFMDNIYGISLTSPDSALTVLSRGLADGLISNENYKCCHATVLYNRAEYDAAASEFEALLDIECSDEIRMEALKRLSYIKAIKGDYESAIRMCITGDSIAKATGNSLLQADFCSNIGFYNQKGDKDAAEKYLQEAISIYRSLDEEKFLMKICQAEGFLITVLEKEGRFSEALDASKDCLEHIDRMEDLGSFRRDGIDRCRFNLYSCLTILYSRINMDEQARESFALMRETQTYKTFSNDRVMVYALMAVQDYSGAERILENYRTDLEAEIPKDSIYLNSNYIETLNLQKECFGAMGLKKDERLIGDLLDSLREELEIDRLNLKVKALSTSYEVQKKEFELQEANHKIHSTRTQLAALLVIMILLAAIAINNVIYNRRIMAKNAKLSEYVSSHARSSCSYEIDDTAREEVSRFISSLEERELYTDSQFNENVLLGELNIKDKNFRSNFKAATGKTFPQYLTELRVANAAELIRDYPQYTFEYIAEKSGFGSRTTMYRAFTAIYALSPKEYRLSSMSEDGGKNRLYAIALRKDDGKD